MSFWSELKKQYQEEMERLNQKDAAKQGSSTQPRHVTDSDLASWFNAADERPTQTTLDLNQMRNYLKAKNPYRWARMQSDMRWARKIFVKLGRNPEDVRWLL
jgi:hypothetical protein